MATVTIESEFHRLTTEVDVPPNLKESEVVGWLRDNDPESLQRVCPHDGCQCEIDCWDIAVE